MTTRSLLLDGDEIDSPTPTTPRPGTVRSVKDPVHDYIKLYPRVCEIIDTREFQRLRQIKQLGTSYYVWPGASHNRFEHCLGVAHLARRQAEHLQKNQPELNITDRDVECVELAGLCHDLGHGPWSHVWDSSFIPIALPGKKWKHEDASEMMFDYLIDNNKIQMPKEDANFIKALIDGDPSRWSGNVKEKAFLFEIVSNKRNGIDVDKFDYISRDCHAIGEKGNLSLTRLIESARVIDNQICYDIKDANQLYELCYTRFSLHKRIYNHKTAIAIEYMIIDALLAAEPHLKIADQVDKPEKYVYLTDDIMGRIECSSDPELAESRAIFDRFRRRDLYKCVDYKVFQWEYRELCRDYITPQRIVDAAKALHADGDENRNLDLLEMHHVIVDLAPMHYGMQDKNPLDSIKFYSKHNPDVCAQAEPGDVSLLMPAVFAEVRLRVYTKDIRFFGIVQAGYRAVLQSMPSPEHDQELATVALTPPATEAPATPLSTSRCLGDISSPRKTPFSNNNFTTVPTSFVPSSPTQRIRKSIGKRMADDDHDGMSPKKRKGL